LGFHFWFVVSGLEFPKDYGENIKRSDDQYYEASNILFGEADEGLH